MLRLSISSPITSGRSLIRFQVSHEVSFSLKLIPEILSRGCGLFALSIRAYSKPESRKIEEKFFFVSLKILKYLILIQLKILQTHHGQEVLEDLQQRGKIEVH